MQIDGVSLGAGTAIILGILVLFFKAKADKAGAQAIEAETKGEDKSLAQQQAENQVKLDQINKEIEDLKNEKQMMRDQIMSPVDRANSWNKPQS